MLVTMAEWSSKLNKIPISCKSDGYLSSRIAKFFTTHSRFRPVKPPSIIPTPRLVSENMQKRVTPLEQLAKKWIKSDRVLTLLDILMNERDQIIRVEFLEKKRSRLDLLHTEVGISSLLKKWPKLFELCMDLKGRLWCGLTLQAEDLLKEKAKLYEAYSDKAAEYVTKLLMLSSDKRLPLYQIWLLSNMLGLPSNFGSAFVHKYPEHFRLVKNQNGGDCLELVSWNSKWAVTELEKSTPGLLNGYDFEPPIRLFLRFPLSISPYYSTEGPDLIGITQARVKKFQTTAYLSPYGVAKGLYQPPRECIKRYVAILHELLSFSVEKRFSMYSLCYARYNLGLPQKLFRFLLKHDLVFYVPGVRQGSIIGLPTRLQVFLKEGFYENGELKEKCPLVLWKEKIERLMGFQRNRIHERKSIGEDEADLEKKSIAAEAKKRRGTVL